MVNLKKANDFKRLQNPGNCVKIGHPHSERSVRSYPQGADFTIPIGWTYRNGDIDLDQSVFSEFQANSINLSSALSCADP